MGRVAAKARVFAFILIEVYALFAHVCLWLMKVNFRCGQCGAALNKQIRINKMPAPVPLKGKTIVITGASRGIGRAIGIRCAQEGANVAILAKTAEPHPKLPGTIYTAAKDVEQAGGKALPIICDIRFEDQVKKAIDQVVKTFGGIDILINNASALGLLQTEQLPLKTYDLMNTINARGTFLCSKYCIPHLVKSSNPHILNISPPLNMNPEYFGSHVGCKSFYNCTHNRHHCKIRNEHVCVRNGQRITR
jgi:NADP-dependent 3-hydroxy acid dehydrogenase YdfG